MRDSEKAPVVLVAANQDFLNDLRNALEDTNLSLLHAPSKTEAMTLLERLKSRIELAIIELELPEFGAWDLIRKLTFEKPLKIIATTSTFPETFFGKIKDIGVDVVVAKAIPAEAWRKTVEEALGENENTL